jgi:hypothetical protein
MREAEAQNRVDRVFAHRARGSHKDTRLCPREDTLRAQPAKTPHFQRARQLQNLSARRSNTMSRLFAAGFVALALASLPVVANAQEGASISVVQAQFTDKIESRKPVSDASALASGQVVTYWVEVSNPNDAQPITLVWKLDGVEAGRQMLDIGHAPHWRTWGSFPTKKAHAIEVQVLDRDGHEIHADTLNL